jgi:hypothetical protein
MAVDSVSELEEGDDVLVRMREDGQLVAKFVACVESTKDERMLGRKIVLETPWTNGYRHVRLSPYDAEFELIDDVDDVSF